MVGVYAVQDRFRQLQARAPRGVTGLQPAVGQLGSRTAGMSKLERDIHTCSRRVVVETSESLFLHLRLEDETSGVRGSGTAPGDLGSNATACQLKDLVAGSHMT